MSRIVYTNGRYVPYGEAHVHVEDRGFQLGHAVYEVIEVLAGALVDATRHLDRLDRSLAEVMIPAPTSRAALLHVVAETLRRNRVADGSVYIQVSRGAAPRDFAMPGPAVRPTLVVISRSGDAAAVEARAETGIAVATAPDIRWGRSDIKTVMLLPACLAKEAARRQGAREAWLVDRDGFVTEGASSNAWIVTAANELVTRQLGPELLAGVTRRTLIDACTREGLQVKERPFRVPEAVAAREAFITSASQTVMPVTSIDGQAIGDGKPGKIARRLRAQFHDAAERLVLSTSHIRPRA